MVCRNINCQHLIVATGRKLYFACNRLNSELSMPHVKSSADSDKSSSVIRRKGDSMWESMWRDWLSASCQFPLMQHHLYHLPPPHTQGFRDEGSCPLITGTSAHGCRNADFQSLDASSGREANQPPPAACVCVVEAKAGTQITQSVMCQLVEVDGHREHVF